MSRDDHESVARRSGLVSAVLLVVLLAATGLPAEHRHLVDDTFVTSCEVRPAVAPRPAPGEFGAARVCRAPQTNARPRALPRTRRVDSRGLPPPRAPTA